MLCVLCVLWLADEVLVGVGDAGVSKRDGGGAGRRESGGGSEDGGGGGGSGSGGRP